MKTTRYAIYFVPTGELAALGSAWLGWDSDAARVCDQPALPGWQGQVSQLTKRPARYGFHATIKPPFRLRQGLERAQLSAAFQEFCKTRALVEAQVISLQRIGTFLALVPGGDTTGIRSLAASCVRELDQFRAPPGQDELDRRRRANLSAQQERNLVNWGYPYVMEDFRFHMTLTGPLKKGDIDPITAEAERWFAPCLDRPFRVESLCLLSEGPDGYFRVLERCALVGTA